ncbi:unnamed protein product [Dibothriocephalus latus]|uniref:V-type proton ATPase subunit n=1 Tax=Dibothriocephalus latus TaxID=60516 RepID=A0A3P7QVM9_DIBLA|nr:unnamed protein product [Dibothriocephalus latus]
MIEAGFYIPIAAVSGFWLLVGLLGPLLVPKSPNRGIWITSIVLTAICCYIFWFIFFLAQWHPLYGPVLSNELIRLINMAWGTV